MEIKFAKVATPRSGTIVALVDESLKLPAFLADLDKKNGSHIIKSAKAAEFKGKRGKVLSVMGGASLPVDRVVLIGIEEDSKEGTTRQKAEEIGGEIMAAMEHMRIKNASVVVDERGEDLGAAAMAAHIAQGARLRSYYFGKYFTKKKEDEKPALKTFTVMVDAVADAEKQYAKLEAISNGVFFARDLVSEPPNVIYPESYAERVKALKELGIKVEVLGEKEMRKLGMGALLGVGQGSVRESQLVVMQYNGAKNPKQAPVAFVGKGVCFDTGGISIKPAAGMEDMKYDMGGSAAVVGTMMALAGRGAKVNAVGVIGLVENMPDGNAQRPSDVVTSMSGQTIEVLNTDAEGRLVLCDALWYTKERFKPRFMVNLATLTGAIVITFGSQYAGLFSNDDELSAQLAASGLKTGERLWRLPLGKEYDRQIDSKIADMQNIGNDKGAGSITAAQFLQRFVGETPWAHLDIAGTAWARKPSKLMPEGASGFGVRLLNQLVADYYEK